MTQPKIYTRGTKLWIRFSLDGQVIKKPLNLDDNRANKKLAQTQIIPQLILKVHSGEFFENEKIKIPTVNEFAPVSFEIHKNERRELTRQRYERLYELHIKPYFAKKSLDKIKASDLARWQNKLSETLSSKSVKGVRTIFRTIIDDALKDEIILRNPFDLIKAPSKGSSKKMNPFNIDEIKMILNHFPDKMKAFCAIGFFAGLRCGEIIGLKIEDIDFENRIISVRRSIRQGIISLPKTENSIRDVEIIDALLPYLIKHRELTLENKEFFFETYMGNYFTTVDKISSHYWKPCLKELGIAYRNPYQMRHTFASMMISNGEDILWVSNMLGHKSSSMTLDHYAKYVKNTKKKRAAFLLN